MSTVEIVAVLVVAVPVLGFVGFVHWWLRAFPNVPLLPIQNYSPPVRSPYFAPQDFQYRPMLYASATSFSNFSLAPGAIWPVASQDDVRAA